MDTWLEAMAKIKETKEGEVNPLDNFVIRPGETGPLIHCEICGLIISLTSDSLATANAESKLHWANTHLDKPK